jgi:hypothetical protein
MDLSAVRERIWFYEFELPDGTRTQTDIPPEVLRIHTSRRDKLRRIIHDRIGDASRLSALDIASHEGYFTLELARHFSLAHGIELRPESVAAAKLMATTLEVSNVQFTQADVLEMSFDVSLQSDFVLVFGLLYHLENPIRVLRLASELARSYILIETQVFPYDVSGQLEDGHYLWQREVHGVFSLSVDYARQREGGSTDIALVPSLNALLFLLHEFGFNDVEVVAPDIDDYEQFRRGTRAVVYGAKTASGSG